MRLREQIPHTGACPQLRREPQVTGPVIQHGLPGRLLLDHVENLMVADPVPTRLGRERFA